MGPGMARPPSPKRFDLPFHISARCTNKDWFAIPLPEVWEIMEEQLFFAVHAFKIEVHAFVLMSNHFHLLTSAPEGNLSECMRYFMTQTSRQLLHKCRRINQIYGGRYHSTVIATYHHFTSAYKYVYRNPVHAGTCAWVEEYPFSTLRGLLGQQRLLIPVAEDHILFDGQVENTLRWLNTAPRPGAWDEVRRALRKSQFELPHTDNRPSPLEVDML